MRGKRTKLHSVKNYYVRTSYSHSQKAGLRISRNWWTWTNSFITLGGWFTEGHVEIAGDESVACVPLGKKACLISKPGPASKFLSNQTNCAKELKKFVGRGPLTRYKHKSFYYLSKRNNLLIQPAKRSVLNFSQAVAMVAGWEAGNDLNSVRVKEATNNYGFGVRKGTLSLIKSVPKKERGQMIDSVKHQGTNDVANLLERLQKQNKWVDIWEKGKQGRPTLEKRKSRARNLPCVKYCKKTSPQKRLVD